MILKNLFLIILFFGAFSSIRSKQSLKSSGLKCVDKYPCTKEQIGKRCGDSNCNLFCKTPMNGILFPLCIK